MHLKRILNHVESLKSFVYKRERLVITAGGSTEIEVDIEPRANSRPICSGCGEKRPGYHRHPTRRFEFVPLWNIAVFFVYAMRRVKCPTCGMTVERVPWAEGKESLTSEVRTGIQFVASDMWKPHLKVIAEQIPAALHVLDRFHIMRNMNVAIDEVRSAEAAQMKQDGYEPILMKSGWCLLKRRENLTDNQEIKLKKLLEYNLESIRTHLLRELFQEFWDFVSPTWAGRFLDTWCTSVMRSKLEPMKKLAKSLRRHRHLILNWFRAKGTISSGVVEGLNGVVKLTTRKAFSFRTAKGIEVALLYVLGRLPQPESTHRFC
jgi:transposase